MKFKAVTGHKLFKPALGAGVAALCGLALWTMPLGERWVNASYDYLFRFGARTVTNQVVIVFMDNDAYDWFQQVRGQPWNRALHAELLNKLAADGCAQVIFDVFFRSSGNPTNDEALAKAMRRHGRVVLMAEQADAALQNVDGTLPNLESLRPLLPAEPFLSAANTNWGIAFLDPDLVDYVVRKHWPFPAPGPSPSLPWTAARLASARLNKAPQEQWLRYYGPAGAWPSLSYRFALSRATNYFREKIVFIGNKPKTTVPDDEKDKFRTPYTRWTGESSGGVEIMATAFLNLMNGDWLRRPAAWVEALLLVATGLLLGGGLGRARPLAACLLASGAALAVTLGAVSWSHHTNYWFPWLVIAGGQVPCALTWALLAPTVHREPQAEVKTLVIKVPPAAPPVTPPPTRPDAPDYELFSLPFADGAYGEVWLARNAIGQWQALKAIYLAKFKNNPEPYDREFRGIQRYKPISDKHPGLLRVDFVSTKKPEGHFYYVMELGDALTPGWEENPATYRPRDLTSVCAQSEGRRLPVRECVRIVLALAEALDFLHRQGLTHRDVKPGNIIFVNGQPKLADVGLVGEIRPPGQESTYVGTWGYMPPSPEPPGTAQADIYGLGMVLYVISNGRDPGSFSAISTTLIERTDQADFIRLNAIILKACQPEREQRYASAAEMCAALREVQAALEREARPDRV